MCGDCDRSRWVSCEFLIDLDILLGEVQKLIDKDETDEGRNHSLESKVELMKRDLDIALGQYMDDRYKTLEDEIARLKKESAFRLLILNCEGIGDIPDPRLRKLLINLRNH